ncbi:MAG TPA: chemotaxis protein CheW [Phenylobacterium sp.]|jgi:purine-binding chemotaxis protein CheW|uniref:Chemotaxis protein CheW n=1 Tax=Phenylobacterium conjunctum TaxID=1298959 RepID=A0ABW3T2W9_9CAUL|nr:chemotaxis protein CheW [Phenylobacterium sp.]HQN50324.1 chemotaxis protein CheW [Phenylobacterium sp.]HQP20509.1 chemotaxis protein CheW [Phenylobacterium sp.]
MTQIVSQSNGARHELIAFRIGDQEFCVDIMQVREIRGWTQATPLPRAPAYVRGVINLRGAVLPIVDLGARLGLTTGEPSARHVIMVVNQGGRTIGLLVEAVSDIIDVTEDMVQPTPDVACDTVKQFVKGLFAIDGRMISLITLERVLPEQEAEAA